MTVFSALIFVSYRYSSKVYYNYLSLYYHKMYTEKELLLKAAGMYDKKKYKELDNFLNPLIIIYPDNNEFKKIAAFNYLQMGDSVRGAELFAATADGSVEESRTLEEILKNLYYSGNYGDLLYFYDKKIMMNNVNTALYYGVALFKKGRYDESYKSLLYAKNNTFMLPELSFYIGLNLDKQGKVEEATAYVKNAYESDKFNQTYKKALIDLYRKTGFYREAETLLRRK